MSDPVLSTIAQLLFTSRNSLNFARIVGELDGVLTRLKPGSVRITWDCEDLVFFDMTETRIVLAWSEVATRGLGACLTIAVGPTPYSDCQGDDPGHDMLCSRLVERIQTRFPPMAVLWHQADFAVNSDLVDALVDAIPDINEILPPVEGILQPLLDTAEAAAAAASPTRTVSSAAPTPEPQAPADRSAEGAAPADPAQAANDSPNLPLPRSVELARLRAALYPVDLETIEAPNSVQMRLAAHAFNATLIMVWAPLGAAVMTYSILRGEDIRLSSRLMAVAGTIFALAHSPVGHTVAAMASALS